MPTHRRPPVTNRSLAVAAALVAVGALTAVTIPALADTQRPANPPPADAAAAPELLAALQRDLGLTSQQAEDRLARQAWASQTIAALRADLDQQQWGGAWLTDGAEQLMVAVTDEHAAERVRAAGAEPRLVSHSQQELAATQAALDARADEADAAIAGWYVDVAANSVVVLANDGADSAARAFASDAVRVVTSDEQPRLLFDIVGGDAYFIEEQSRCSVGFSVEGGFVTAGHCALAGVSTTGSNGEPQGEFVAASFPGDDWGVVAVNQDWVPQPLVTDFAGGLLPVAGAAEAPVGSSVCKHGSTTGVSCGTVQALDATVNYPEGTVTGLTRTDACAEPGDSGGAWLAGDQAQGVTSGGSGDCTFGGITFFQPLGEILEVNGLTLVTTG